MPFNETKASQIHNNKYDYSLVNYCNIDTKVTIICPIHGKFCQTPYHHINRKQGCGQCKGNKISQTKRFSKEKFIANANKIHGQYDYSKVDYVNARTKVIIICKKHGEFYQTPDMHVCSQNGCPSCGYNTSKTANQWLDSLGIPQECREQTIYIAGVRYKVDGLVGNTIYEYFGYFWHGHPDYFHPDDINPKNKVRYGELYDRTLKRISNIRNSNYKLIYRWG